MVTTGSKLSYLLCDLETLRCYTAAPTKQWGNAKWYYFGPCLCRPHLWRSVPRQHPQGLGFVPFVEADLCGNGK